VNGASGGTTVSARASMSVAVANGPGNRADWIGVCNSGATPAFGQCDGAGYGWDYLNCTQTYPSTGSTSASCNLAAPSAEGDYIVGFFSNDIYTVLASAPFTVSGGGGGGGGGPSLVQTVLTSLFVGGVSVDNQQCTNTWGPGSAAGGSAIGTGDTVVGYVHLGDSLQDGTTYLHPNWISDNLGNTYTMQTVNWVPWGETITIFYGTNVQGNPTSFTIDFSQYPASGGTIPGPCDLGFAEYSGVSGVNATAGPTISPGANPSLSITTTAPSVVFLYGALNWDSFGTLHNTGYTGMIDDHSFNGMVVWQGNVPAGQTTYVWDNGEGASGTCSYDPNGCPAGVAAVALQ